MAVIRVEIERLTLTGMRRGQRDRVVEAFQRELTRLLAVGGRPGISAGDRDRVTGGVPLTPTTDPRRLGRRLARSVHAVLLEQANHRQVGHGPSQPANHDADGHGSTSHDQDRGLGGAR